MFSLQEILGLPTRAIHVGGRAFIDRPGTPRRFLRIQILGVDAESAPDMTDDDLGPLWTSDAPEDFPQDGWIPLDDF